MIPPSCENYITAAKYNHVTLFLQAFNCSFLTPSRSLSMYEHRSTPKSSHLTFEGKAYTLMDSWRPCPLVWLGCQRVPTNCIGCVTGSVEGKTKQKPWFIWPWNVGGKPYQCSLSKRYMMWGNHYRSNRKPTSTNDWAIPGFQPKGWTRHSARFRRSPRGLALHTLSSGHVPERGPQRVCEMWWWPGGSCSADYPILSSSE